MCRQAIDLVQAAKAKITQSLVHHGATRSRRLPSLGSRPRLAVSLPPYRELIGKPALEVLYIAYMAKPTQCAGFSQGPPVETLWMSHVNRDTSGCRLLRSP